MRTRGRPHLAPAFPMYVWLMVELARDRRSRSGRFSALRASKRIAEKLEFPVESVRRWHKDFSRERAMRPEAQEALDFLRREREAKDWKIDEIELCAEAHKRDGDIDAEIALLRSLSI